LVEIYAKIFGGLKGWKDYFMVFYKRLQQQTVINHGFPPLYRDIIVKKLKIVD